MLTNSSAAERSSHDSPILDGVGPHQQVLVVKQVDFGHLQNEEVKNLDEEHEEEFPDAADLQEDGGGQQAQQNAEGEVLGEDRQSKGRLP